jgi:hypothetical protein
LLVAIASATNVQAQEVSAEDREVARGLMGRTGKLAPPLRARCEAPKGNDIVVCAQDQNRFRAQSSADEDPESDQALNDGRLTPPDVSGRGIFKGKPTIAGQCFIPPCPPPPAYMIDLSTIPEAPAGSDADKIAKGEIRAP